MANLNQEFLEIPIWPGSASFYTGSAPFGYFESDPTYQAHAPKVADYCAKKLGYPIQDVEMVDYLFFTCFEEAILEYSAQVNQFNIRENLLVLQGTTIITGSSYTGTNIKPTLGRLIQLAKNYGTEAGSGGNVDWKRGMILLEADKQIYDFNTETMMPVLMVSGCFPYPLPTGSDNGKPVEIKRVFHMESQLMTQFVGTTDYGQSSISYDTQLLLDSFGWGNMAVGGASFLLTPLSYDLMRMQAIEFNQQIRRSSYSFEIKNNKISIFPIPRHPQSIFFEYIVIDERDNLNEQVSGSLGGSGLVSDYSNIPYAFAHYSSINDVGRQWILKYTLACAKEILGNIRNKYSSITLPNGDVTLNGADLLSQSQTEKEALITQLRENLDQASRRMQLERQKDESDFMQEQLTKVPLHIYIR